MALISFFLRGGHGEAVRQFLWRLAATCYRRSWATAFPALSG